MALDVVMDAVGATVTGRDIHELVTSPVERDALGQRVVRGYPETGVGTNIDLLDLLYLSTLFLWWQAVADIIGVTSGNALRNNSRCTWRYRAGARNGDNIAICGAFSLLRPCANITADVHGVAPIRHPLAIRDTPVAHTGEETTPSPHHATGCAAHPSFLFSPPGNGLSTLDARWKPLIGQYNNGITRGDTVGIPSANYSIEN
jgi:hypothetical protein